MKSRYVFIKLELNKMHRTCASHNQGSSAMLPGTKIQGGFQNAQRKICNVKIHVDVVNIYVAKHYVYVAKIQIVINYAQVVIIHF